MTVKNIERNGNETKIVVEIDKELMEKGVNAAYLKQRKNIMLPGFRKGKAPRKMIESMYGAHVFYEDGLEEIFPEVYPEVTLGQYKQPAPARFRTGARSDRPFPTVPRPDRDGKSPPPPGTGGCAAEIARRSGGGKHRPAGRFLHFRAGRDGQPAAPRRKQYRGLGSPVPTGQDPPRPS